MRVLILGGGGMLGHKLWQAYQERYDVWVTFRSEFARYAKFGIFDQNRAITGVEAFNFDSIVRAFSQVKPDAVVNCIGIIKQRPEAEDAILSLSVNSLFPHRLAQLCRSTGARLLHISTDCVFNGRKGMYTEADPSDADDLYGRTKYLGEASGDGSLTLRTSIIGRELGTASGLIEWFLSNRGGRIRGFTRARYTGLTTIAFARIIADILEKFPALSGVYQVSSEPISKYELLKLVNSEFDARVTIVEDDSFACDRSLDSSRFRSEVGFHPPSWQQMITEMAEDPTSYDAWFAARRQG